MDEKRMRMLEKAKKLARHTEGLAAGPGWGVDDQDVLEWLINEVENLPQVIGPFRYIDERGEGLAMTIYGGFRPAERPGERRALLCF
ncbi:hypothetical protein [Desulfobotulus sp.]|uniref:hypothetical protein n=1 Tax=Desulfobotulus sp. TaxID=1940337 RepID=UPI002A35ACAA|nr:hypothetical protein [Desulfobotulus sp.]MDY0164309.1 hypothetical protein [Desulfobotulus sp.]